MVPRERLGSARVPGGAELQLVRRGDDFMILLDRNELMSSRMSGSEEVLATGTAERLAGRAGQRWLVGGYGMGFTLRAGLRTLPRDAAIDVVEICPEIIEWARGPMAALADGCLDDPRVHLSIGDVGAAIGAGLARYDAILLDVDNGPDGLSRAANDGLYSLVGLAMARSALRPGGLLAIWSAGPDKVFAKRLGQAGFAVEEITTAARSNGKGPRHTIWFARKSG